MKGDCEDLNDLGKQIQQNNAKSFALSLHRNGNKENLNNDKIEHLGNNLDSPTNRIKNDNTQAFENPFKLAENINNGYTKNNEDYDLKNENNIDIINYKKEKMSTLIQNTDDPGSGNSQNDLNKLNNKFPNENPQIIQDKPIFKKIENLIYDSEQCLNVLPTNDKKILESSKTNNFQYNFEEIKDEKNYSILENNTNLEETKREIDNLKSKSNNNILEHTIKDSNNHNDQINEIKIHLPLDPEYDLVSTVKILGNEKVSNPFSFKDLNQIRNEDNFRQEKKEIRKFNTGGLKEQKNSKIEFEIQNQNKNQQVYRDNSGAPVFDEIEDEKTDHKMKLFNKTVFSSVINVKNPFIETNILNHEFLRHRPTSINFPVNLNLDNNNHDHNTNVNENIGLENLANRKFNYLNKINENNNMNNCIFPQFRNGELKKKMQSNNHLLMINQKLSLNDNLKTDKNVEQNLDIISKYELLNKSNNSNLSSDEGDEFYDADRTNFEKNINDIYYKRKSNNDHNIKNISVPIQNLNQIDLVNFQNINNKNKNHIIIKEKKNLENRRRSLTPNISLENRNNLIEKINIKLMHNLDIDEYRRNLNNGYITPNENGKDNPDDISDGSIIQYFMENHVFDDTQGQLYNPTFLGYFLNKQNLNDTNNKILMNSNNSKNKIINLTNSKNGINKKISLNEIKNLIREKNLNNSNVKDILKSKPIKNEIDISENAENNSLYQINKDNSINIDNINNQNDFKFNKNNCSITTKNIRNKHNNSNNLRLDDDDEDSNIISKYDLNNHEENGKSEKGKENESLEKEKNRKNALNLKQKKTKNLKNNAKNVNFENNNDYDENLNPTTTRGRTSYADPSLFISSKPQKRPILNLENFNSTPNNNKMPFNESKKLDSIKKLPEVQNCSAPENKDIDNLQPSDERNFISNDIKKSKTKNPEFLQASNNKRETIKNFPNQVKIDPTRDLLKSTLEKGQKINLQQIMENLENLILENEKNKKKALINFIDFNKNSTNENPNENFLFKIMNLGILIEGDSISHCLDDDLKDLFWNIVKNSKSVVCCRCSPKQKAEVVGFVKYKSNQVTLAIGDGGNDIPMIKLANIGVGIFGKEGYQAAFNSDYAISQFKYLKRLVFVHGRNSLLKNSYFIYFFFFKNVLFTLTQLWFCFFSGFSGQVNILHLFN